MGSSSSKFRKYLQNGDEYAALQLYNGSSDLRKGLDPNLSYGDTYNHDTPLHFATRHGMKSLLRIFLHELGGNPNKKNARNETALHCVCQALNGRNYAVQQRRFDCVLLILQWRGAKLKDGEVERVDLGAQDEKNNTALHYAAASGLKRCVEVLINQSSPLFVENNQKQTPCDCAEKNGQNDIALYLESKMVFSPVEENTDELDDMLDTMESEEGYSGLRAQDLQEAKDQLLVETSDMLRVPLFTAEALLRNHEWSREMLLEAWMDDAVACCDKCGVVPPGHLGDQPIRQPEIVEQAPAISTGDMGTSSTLDLICDICASLIPAGEEPVPMSCDHQFCRSCWERYLTQKIQEGDAHNITCPGFQCCRLVPVEIIESVVSRDIARRYLQFDIKAFVDSNPSINWCPYPGCGRAVRLPDSDNPLSPTFQMSTNMNTIDFSHAVDCGNGHIFCWECLGEAHEPASCENWKRWHQKIAEVKPEESIRISVSGIEEASEIAANCLWLVTNSKSCPNCKSPIQKNEGCNHMKCSKCKHDFCWVCLEAWKKHSSATGGYFRCNRYEVVKKVEEFSNELKSEAEARNKKMQELNKFVHYYSRFKNHENSFKLEEPLLNTAKEKMMILAKAFTDADTANLETKFVEDGVHQLLKARRVLKCSYVYGYYLEETGYKKPIFEFMQTELEECTETLSEMIARPYLRTPRSKIIQTAHLVQRKRHEFVVAIAKGLVPPDSSPNMKRRRRKYSVELDEDLKKALMDSLQELDPNNPWVKDASGRHTNVTALLDWPEESDDSEADTTSPRHAITGPANTDEPGTSTSPTDPPQEPTAFCARLNCGRPCAVNPRTGDIHKHCSMRCMRQEKIELAENTDSPQIEYFIEPEMDLLRALEMSRLQFLREMGQLRPGNGERSPRSPALSPGLSPGPSISPGHSRSPDPLKRISGGSLHEDQVSSLVLKDPPLGKTGRTVCKHPGGGDHPVDFDMELHRALELSRITVQEEERELRMAIELSLQDSSKREDGPSTSGLQPRLSDPHPDSLDAEYSSIVTRVPNKSVEDLRRSDLDSSVESETGLVGACGGGSGSLTSASHHPRVMRDSEPCGRTTCQGESGKANTFGLIKDLSVSNILADDKNKTSDFESKDFKYFCVKMPGNEEEMERRVFEPRPFTQLRSGVGENSPTNVNEPACRQTQEDWIPSNNPYMCSCQGQYTETDFPVQPVSSTAANQDFPSPPPPPPPPSATELGDAESFIEYDPFPEPNLDAVLRSLSSLTSKLKSLEEETEVDSILVSLEQIEQEAENELNESDELPPQASSETNRTQESPTSQNDPDGDSPVFV